MGIIARLHRAVGGAVAGADIAAAGASSAAWKGLHQEIPSNQLSPCYKLQIINDRCIRR